MRTSKDIYPESDDHYTKGGNPMADGLETNFGADANIPGMFAARGTRPRPTRVEAGGLATDFDPRSRAGRNGLAEEWEGVGRDTPVDRDGDPTIENNMPKQPQEFGGMGAGGMASILGVLGAYKGHLDKIGRKGYKPTAKDIYQVGDPTGGGMFGKEAAAQAWGGRAVRAMPGNFGFSASMGRHI